MFAALSADEWTRVERGFIAESVHRENYPEEKIKTLEVSDYRQLGRLLAYRFLEWARANPRGVIALPTGKTPEAFIEAMAFLKKHWNEPEVQQELSRYGLAGYTPELSGLKFVQLDEFVGIDPRHPNSFANYIRQHYLKPFGIREALLMEGVEPESYEKKIREWGGIGFFVGGVGIDGHVAFNMPGSSAQSRTRIEKLTYIPAAQSAISLGGMEFTRDRPVMTVGFDTLFFNPHATLILMAAGEGKARAVQRAIEGPLTTQLPASLFQSHPNARFYITKGAAKDLTSRRLEDIEKHPLTNQMIDEAVLSIALAKKKRIQQLTAADLQLDPRGKILLSRLRLRPTELKEEVHRRLLAKLQAPIPDGKRILHTGPHHDDVLLSYFGYLRELLAHSGNLFVYLTSGFNAVTDAYMKERLALIANAEVDPYDALEFPYAMLLVRMLRAARQQNESDLKTYEAYLLMRHMSLIYKETEPNKIRRRAQTLLNNYFAKKIPGAKDAPEVQLLKGAIRESEEDRHMTYHGVPIRDVIHLRSQFYTGDYFNPPPTIEKDAKPLLQILDSYKPHIITVALDPEGTGPDTHYKALQIVNAAIQLSNLEPRIWGYRNVWHDFSLAEADRIVPVTEEQLKNLHECFMTCYTTQKEAPFPALQYDGPFSEFAVLKQREQLAEVKALLGDAVPKDAAGLIYLKELDKAELAAHVKGL